MTKITNPQFDAASYVDPRGRIFHHNGQLFRAFAPGVCDFYKELFSSSRMAALTAQGKVIETELMPGLEIDGFGLVARQRKIDHVSYYFEWSPGMLRDAALLTLDIAVDFCEDNIVLQDATPYNVLFDAAKPIFIDICSFTPVIPAYVWSAYQQFCNFFLFPLYLFSHGDYSLTYPLIKGSGEGVSADFVIRILNFFEKAATPGYFSRVFLPEALSKAGGAPSDQKKLRTLLFYLSEKKKPAELRRIRKSFLMNLRKDVLHMHLPGETGKRWSNYYQGTRQDVLQKKLSLVETATRELHPRTVLDIGCNKGAFSIAASNLGVKVASFDTDPYCIDGLYRHAQSQGLDILPLVMNALNPTPGMGWRGAQLRSAQERFAADMVYALAIVHHLVFSEGLDFTAIIQSLKDFCKKWLIIEYVSADDPMAEVLPRRPSIDYSWYTRDNFLKKLSEHFSEISILAEISDTRTLVLARI